MSNIFDSVEDAIRDIADGKLIIVTDDENRENEGDLVVAAEKVTPEIVTMLIKAGGLICVPTTSDRLSHLGLGDMVNINRDSKGTAFTISVDSSSGITTGMSASDRALTIKNLSNFSLGSESFVSPGHIFPLKARAGGVLERAGHTEASVDLAKLAGLNPCCAICEIVNPDGTMARLPDLIEFRKKHNLKLISVASIIEYRLKRDKLIKIVATKKIKTKFGEFNFVTMKSLADGKVHFALLKGEITEAPTLARVHSENIFADLFAVENFSSGNNSFERAMAEIAKNGGAVIYISRECGGLNIQEGEPIAPTIRDYGTGAQILRELGFKKIKLLTTHLGIHHLPEGYGLEIVEEILF